VHEHEVSGAELPPTLVPACLELRWHRSVPLAQGSVAGWAVHRGWAEEAV